MVRGFVRRLSVVEVLACILFVMVATSASAAPYCLLRKPFSPPQENCFQFYLSDTAVAAPRTMAAIGAAGCEVSDYAARQGWLPDAMVPGPHATAGEGDAAMSVVSPYFGDAYQCRASKDNGSNARPGGPGSAGGGTGCTEVQTIDQPEQRDGSGTITVEAAIIHVMNCPGNRQGLSLRISEPHGLPRDRSSELVAAAGRARFRIDGRGAGRGRDGPGPGRSSGGPTRMFPPRSPTPISPGCGSSGPSPSTASSPAARGRAGRSAARPSTAWLPRCPAAATRRTSRSSASSRVAAGASNAPPGSRPREAPAARPGTAPDKAG